MSQRCAAGSRSYAKVVKGKLCLVTVTQEPDGPCIQRTQVMPDLFAKKAPLQSPKPTTI